MARKRLLMACANAWDSPFQVGSHHLARGFVRAGWDVAFVSDPISPWHLGRGLTPELSRRFAIYRAGGRDDLGGRLWTYVPAAVVTPHAMPVLRSAFVHRNWHRWTWPNVVAKVRSRGFAGVDLLYVDSVHQSFWLSAVDYDQAVYRVTDYSPLFEKYTAATAVLERDMARRADLVVYPSRKLGEYVNGLGPRRSMCLPNGVNYEHFARRPVPPPPEYRHIARPIAVFVGAIGPWFHFDWVRQAARQLPEFSFVLIGPHELARPELGGMANVHLLGQRDYAMLPGYLQHADVGLMPFDAVNHRRAVEVLNPLKLYEYLASGLPVVSAAWEEIESLNTPALVCDSADQFVATIRQAAHEPGDPEARRRYAARFDWQNRVTALLEALQRVETPHCAA